MATAWDRISNLTNRCSDYYERVEYVRFLNGTNVTHTCKPPIRHCLAVELVSACGRVNVPDIAITQNVNDSLDLRDRTGAPFTAIIPPGSYTYKQLGDSLEGIIESYSTSTENWAGTTYDPVASRFVLAVNIALAGIQFGTGPSFGVRSAAATLGFAEIDSVGASPYLGSVTGQNRSNCYHLTSNTLGRGRLYGVNDSDGPTGSLLWTLPSDEPIKAVARVHHYPPCLVSFAWGHTQIISDFDLSIVCDSDYLLTGATEPCQTAYFTGTICLRFLVARNPEL